MNAPSAPTPSPVPFRSHARRRAFEIGFWVVTTLINAVANSVTVLMDIRRTRLDFGAWEPVTWEWSSAVLMLALAPAVVWFTRRVPLHWDTWRRTLPLYVLASLVFSLAHVLGMVAIREVVYAAHGAEYDFGPWLEQLGYEYLKDVRSFASMVVLVEGYRFIRRRLQGEASLLGEPARRAGRRPAGRAGRTSRALPHPQARSRVPRRRQRHRMAAGRGQLREPARARTRLSAAMHDGDDRGTT